jgi:hypothetical protein
MPNIDWAKKIAYEGKVSVPAGEEFDRAYDLALFEDLNDKDALVLLVTVILDFKFTGEGDGGMWTSTDKTNFMNSVKNECEPAWSDKFRIMRPTVPGLAVGTSDTVPVDRGGGRNVARVVILIKTAEDMYPWQSHWTVTAYKMIKPGAGPTPTGDHFYVNHNGDVRFDSTGGPNLDLVQPFGAPNKRPPVIHEFGHMLGYKDEYKGSQRGIDFYLNDQDSIMNWGTTIRERHYVFFADWITNKLGTFWQVEGRTSLKNTLLGKARVNS